MKAIFCALLCCAVAARAQDVPAPPLEGRSTGARATVPLAALPESPPPPPPEDRPEQVKPLAEPPLFVEHQPWRRRVHLLTSDSRVQLRRAGNIVVCSAPCDTVIEFWPDDEFHLGGNGLADSARFSFALRPEDATLTVHPRTSNAKVAGTGIAVLGAVTAAVGGVGLFLGAAVCNTDNDRGGGCGAGGLILGSALVVVLGLTAAYVGSTMARGTEFDVR